ISQIVGDGERAPADLRRLLPLPENVEREDHVAEDPAQPASVTEVGHESLAYPQAVEGSSEFEQRCERMTKLESEVDRELQRLTIRRRRSKRGQRLFEALDGFPISTATHRLVPSPTKVGNRLVLLLGSERMVGEMIDLLGEAIRVGLLDSVDDPRVEEASTFLEQATVCDLVGQGVLERVLEIGEEAPLVQELGRLKVREVAANTRLVQFR